MPFCIEGRRSDGADVELLLAEEGERVELRRKFSWTERELESQR